ncbi:MAG: HAD-IC family P-type ATPase, partial [Parcubacteria group bacterium]|nr:HAD-IC family P-type ATPase [Parcubacteria group bacterium]
VVVRGGVQSVVDSSMLVPGDVVVLRDGDKVPADGRILTTSHLEVDEAVLTGEWLPIEKKGELLPKGTTITEQMNMVWAGTGVVGGRGVYVVTATGPETIYGKIALLAGQARPKGTPLTSDLQQLARVVSKALAVVVALLFLLGLGRGVPPVTMFLTAIAVTVAAVPEGLPAAISVVLAIGMNRILRRRGLIRQILATETLGRASVILTDKTGTLTQGRMQVSRIMTCREAIVHSGARLEKEKLESLASHIAVLKVGILTSEAFVDHVAVDLDEWLPHGRPTDRAYLLAAIQTGINPQMVFANEPRLDFLQFSSERRYAASLHQGTGSLRRLYVVGAAEEILHASTVCYDDGNIQGFDEYRGQLEVNFKKSVGEGERVLGVGFRDVEIEKFPEDEVSLRALLSGLTLVGLISFHDPIRPDVSQAMIDAQSAGIKPVVVTGDNVMTARAVAERAGLSIRPEEMIEGKDLEAMTDEELATRITRYALYARTLPEQKLRVVQAWQSQGEVVAVVGDGVNDAPALKKADIGVAVGSGTEVAKEASQLVLLDNSFSIIVRAIEEGRVILDNIQKVVTYLLATGFTELILIGGSLVMGLPLPILPVQILWTNIVEEGIQTFSLAFEPKEDDVMRRAPRKSKEPFFTREMFYLIFLIGVITDLYLFGLLLIMWYKGYPLAEIRTVMFLGMSVAALVSIYALKSLRRPFWRVNILGNRYLLLATALNVLLLFAIIRVPLLRDLLRIVSPTSDQLLMVAGVGILTFFSFEAGKYYFITKRQTG